MSPQSLSRVFVLFATSVIAPPQEPCPHQHAVPVQKQVDTYGVQFCYGQLELSTGGILPFLVPCPRIIWVDFPYHDSRPTSADTTVEVDHMVPVLVFHPRCKRVLMLAMYVETCSSQAPALVLSRPSYRTVPCR